MTDHLTHDETHAAAAHSRWPKVLVVDDNQDNLDLIVELFQGEPWNVKTVDSGIDAWAIIKRWHPDLILLDIRMPGVDGRHICSAVRSQSEMDDIPIIFLTAEHTAPEEIEEGLKMGACDYLCKPINKALLLDRIRAAIRAHQRHPARA